jgi:aspartate-semialdehyde dehydrogenase
MKPVTEKEYRKALEILKRYQNQFIPKTVQVSVTYAASVSVTLRVPKEFTEQQIKDALVDGYFDFDTEEDPRVNLDKMTELIVGGYEVKI